MIFIFTMLLLIASTPASADPVITPLAATALIGSLSTATGISAVGIATGIIATAASAALSAASLGLQLLLAGRRSGAKPQDLKNTTKGSEGAGRYAFGRVELGGLVAFGNTSGYKIYRVLLHAFGPIDAVETYIYGGLDIVVDSDGQVASPPWAHSTGSYMNIKVAVGDGTETAWADLLADFSTQWSSAHKIQGIAHSLLKITSPGTNSATFPKLLNGGVKELNLQARMGKFYDPRDVSTIWSLNAALHCLHYLRLLPGISDADLDLTDIGVVATASEVSVTTLAGTAPRAQLSGGWEGPLTSDIVEDMLVSAGLEIILTDQGTFTFSFIEDSPAAEIIITSRHIIAREYRAGPEAAKRPNICKLEYFSPERRYEVAELDLTGASWAKVQGEIDKYGEQEFRAQLIFCCDASQAQRIARRLFYMARADFGTITTTFAGVALWGVRTASIEFPDVGVDGASVFKTCRLGTVRVNDAAGTCEIPFQVIPDELKVAWDAATDEQPAPPVLAISQFEAALPKPTVPSASAIVQYPSSAYEVRVRFASVAGAVTAEGNVRSYTSGLPNAWSSMTEPSLSFAYRAENLTGLQVDFRVRFADSAGDVSHFSDLLEVGSLDIVNTALTAPALGVVIVGSNDFDSTVTLAGDMHVASVQLQYRLYLPGVTPGGWLIQDTRNARPSDSYTVRMTESIAIMEFDETIEIRAVAYTSNSTSTASSTYTYQKASS